jgi:hypothetical protein
MRKKIIIGLVVLAFAAVVASIWLLPTKPHPGPWKLSDGSRLSLAGVTYGKKHTMRYGNGIADYLYPILSPALRKKFGCKVATVVTSDTNAVVLWFLDKDLKNTGTAIKGIRFFPHTIFHFSTVDKNGTEFAFHSFPISEVLWNTTNVLQGFELPYFPRRENNIRIRIYEFRDLSHPVAEFTIPNRASTNYPVWTAAPLPVRVRTNDLDVSLLKLETIPGKSPSGSYARAEFRFTRNDELCDDWTIYQVTARAATSEGVPSEVWNELRPGRQTISVNFKMALWTEETWKLTAELWRKTNYPPAECWTTGGVAVPGEGQTNYLNAATNLYGKNVELVAIRGGPLVGKSDGHTYRRAVLVLRSPMGVSDARVRLAEVTDNLGRKVAFEMDLETADPLGGIGTLDKEYILNIPDDAKTLDITAAYTKTVFVDFMARPVLANAKQEPKK